MSCALLPKLEKFGGDVVKFNENEELSFFMAEMKKIKKKMYSLVLHEKDTIIIRQQSTFSVFR